MGQLRKLFFAILFVQVTLFSPVLVTAQGYCALLFDPVIENLTSGEQQTNVSSFSMERVQIQLEGLFGVIEAKYGPLLFKEKRLGFNWNIKKEEYRTLVTSVENTNEIYFLFARLLNDLKDAHVSTRLPSTYTKKLPLEFTEEEGVTFVSFVKGADYPNDVRIPEVGDELIEMDGRSASEWRAIFANYLSTGRKETDEKTLSRTLTSRAQARGLPVKVEKNPKSTMKLKSRESGEVYEITLDWKADGVPLIGRNIDGSIDPDIFQQLFEMDQNDESEGAVELLPRSQYLKSLSAHFTQIFKLQNQMMSLQSPVASAYAEEASNKDEEDKDIEDRGKPFKIGDTKPFFKLPKDFKKIKSPLLMKGVISASNLYAGTFKRDGKTVGFLRIPTYMPGNIMMAYFAVQYIMNWFENNVDYLVIDQTSNGGGAVVYGDWITQSLVPQASIDKHMKFKVRPTQGFLRNFATLIDSLQDVAENEELKGKAKEQAIEMRDKYVPLIKEEFNKVYTAYANGDFFSEPVSLYIMSDYLAEMLRNLPVSVTNGNQTFEKWLLKGVKWFFGFDVNQAHHFTKPAYMLINELDFSGGDAVPAILSDYDRVTLIGANTAGAGGAVISASSDVQMPFNFSLTNSLMVRANGELVENIGVAPDVKFELKVEDYVNGFENVFERYMTEIDKLEAGQ